MTQHLARHYHGFFLNELDLVLLLHHFPPSINQIMDIDFHGANIRATAIQGR